MDADGRGYGERRRGWRSGIHPNREEGRWRGDVGGLGLAGGFGVVFVDDQGDKGGASVADRTALATVMASGGDTRGRKTIAGVGTVALGQ